MLSTDRRARLQGYYNLLRDAPGNGAVVHKTRQYMTVLLMRLRMDIDIADDYEEDVKKVIRVLYPVDKQVS